MSQESPADSPPPDSLLPLLAPGYRPLPEYGLVRLLGEGGFGMVWEAIGPGGVPVALKFIPLSRSQGTAELRALQLMVPVRHPHLLTLFGAWQRGGVLILAMELAEGTLYDRLKTCLAEGKPGIERGRLLPYLSEAARGIDFLNGRHIQHRDIKPGNLMLVGGCVKVGDFGLVRALRGAITRTTQGGYTLAYAAPELLDNRISDRVDQYALAATYCQLRGGRLPFEGVPTEVAIGHLHHPPDLTMLPQGERDAVARALSKQPEDRWPSCLAFVRALVRAPAEASLPPQPRPPVSRDTETVTVPPLPATRTRPADRPRPNTRRPALLAFGLGIPLLLLVAVPLIYRSWPTEQGEPVAESNNLPPREAEAPKQVPPATTDGAGEGKPAPPAVPPRQEADPAGTITNSLGMKLVPVPAGSFLRGSPPHEPGRSAPYEPMGVVEITRPFYLGMHEVTQGQFEKVMGTRPGYFSPTGEGKQAIAGLDWHTLPVESVPWEQAVEFCKRLSNVPAEQKQGRVYRLPTEAEWEYACRDGGRERGPFSIRGTDPRFLSSKHANFNGKEPYGEASVGPNLRRTAPVGSYPPNGLGLYDMHGNVYEWCSDWFGPYSPQQNRDPTGAAEGAGRSKSVGHVVRGGAWSTPGRQCRAASRAWGTAEGAPNCLGFRVALTAGK